MTPVVGDQQRYVSEVWDHLNEFRQLAGSRINFETHWQETAELMAPWYRNLFTWNNLTVPGEKHTDRQVDVTAMQCLKIFVAIVDSLLTPVDSRWHLLRNPDPKVMKSRNARLWYERACDTLFDYRYMPQSGFIGQNQGVWRNLGAFGTGVLYTDEYKGPRGQRGLRYRNIPIHEAYLKENHQGIVDTVYRAFYMTPRQMMQRWGEDALPPELAKRAMTPGDSEGMMGMIGMVRVIHCVHPRADYDPTHPAKDKPWESVYISYDQNHLLSKGGYTSFPYAVSRYEVAPNEVYGRGPGMAILPVAKTINLEKKTLIKQGHRTVDPVIFTMDDGIVDNWSYGPGKINKGGVNEQGKPLFTTLPVGQWQVGKELYDTDVASIRDEFMVNLFQILTETPTMTATEVIERTREKATLMAPPLSRQVEYLGTLIDREMDLLDRMGAFGERIPIEILRSRQHFKVVYTSPLARAKKAEEAAGSIRTIETALNWVNVTQNPALLNRFKLDDVLKDLAWTNAMPERLLNSDEEVAALAQQQAQAAEREQQNREAPSAAALIKAKAVAAKAGVQPQAMPRTPFASQPMEAP